MFEYLHIEQLDGARPQCAMRRQKVSGKWVKNLTNDELYRAAINRVNLEVKQYEEDFIHRDCDQ